MSLLRPCAGFCSLAFSLSSSTRCPFGVPVHLQPSQCWECGVVGQLMSTDSWPELWGALGEPWLPSVPLHCQSCSAARSSHGQQREWFLPTASAEGSDCSVRWFHTRAWERPAELLLSSGTEGTAAACRAKPEWACPRCENQPGLLC